MTRKQLQKAFDIIAGDDGDGFYVSVFTTGGHKFTGGIGFYDDVDIVQIADNANLRNIAYVAIADIVAIQEEP